jgi:two-component system phosphate regulon sensor histidine kinase PhoR
MAGSQSEQKYQLPPKGKVEELDQALNLLTLKLESLVSDLGGEKEKMAAILSTIDAGILLLNREMNITMLNKKAEDLFKVSSEVALGKPFVNLVRDHDMVTTVQKCIETVQNQTVAVRMFGTKQYLELKSIPLSNGVLVLVQDLTNIRKLEKIRQAFIANISHELRTPIASCKAIVETLQGGAIDDKNVVEDFLQRMHVETDKLAQMVSELGELSRIESGELILERKPVDLTDVINNVIDRLKTQADRAQLSIILDIPRDLPSIVGDAYRIEQVLVNLAQNAIKFTPPNGEITIASMVHENEVLTSVSDTGVGISEDDLPHIFERFYKVDKARSGGGTGLGLAIAKHIVRAHGGDIWAESKEREGSIFSFSLPVARS